MSNEFFGSRLGITAAGLAVFAVAHSFIGCSSSDDTSSSNGGSAGSSVGGAGGRAGSSSGGTGGTAGRAGSSSGGVSSGGTAGSLGSAGEPTAAGAAGEAGGGAERSFVYIETNDVTNNALLAFERGADGSLSPLPGGSFATLGEGIDAGADQRLGPLDSDQELVLSSDRSLLFAVNAGSDNIAVFHTSADGMLSPVTGSPFASGGKNPVSLGLDGSTLFVVNKATDGSVAPNYTAFTVGQDGTLTAIAGSTAAQPLGGSPAVAYISPDRKFLFGTEFLDGARAMSAPAGQIDAFAIGASGALTPVPGAPYALPADTSGTTPPPPPVALNVIEHPTQQLLYVPFVTRSQLGVYSIAATGALTFERAAPNSGKAICWLLIDKAAHYLYSVNSGSGTISTYDISDATHPTETGAITLKQAMSGPPFMDAMGMTQTVTSQPFQFAFDADQSHLYVVSQRATTNDTDLTGNYLHTLQVKPDGSLGEPSAPIDLSTLGFNPTARPQGIVVF